MGRRYCLAFSAALNALLGIIASVSMSCLPLLIMSIFTVISPSANEIGPIVAIELAGLSQVISKSNVKKYISWYKLFGSFTSGIAMAINGILFSYFQSYLSVHQLYVVILLSYSVCQLSLAIWCFRISPDFDVVTNHQIAAKDVDPIKAYSKLSESSKQALYHVISFYLTDSYASSYVTLLLIVLYLQSTYYFQPFTCSVLSAFFLVLAGLSDACDDTICSYFGLVQSVVVFQFPANIILVILPYIPFSYSYMTISLLLLRYSISQFDSPIRNAYVNLVISPSDRSGMNTLVNMVRAIAIVLAPYVIYALSGLRITISFAVALSGWLKIAYDIALMSDYMVAHNDTVTQTDNPFPSSPLNQPHSPMRMQ